MRGAHSLKIAKSKATNPDEIWAFAREEVEVRTEL